MKNPFQPTKFEWEKRPVIWLSDTARSLRGSIKPVYISGSRGSGKTTILRSLSTRQLALDPHLLRQHGSMRLNWFGQYLQFNKTFQKSTERIVRRLDGYLPEEEAEQRVFETYFELTLLFHCFNDIIQFQDRDFLHLTSKHERAACGELSSILKGSKWVAERKINDFRDARRVCRELLLEFLKSKSEFDAKGVTELTNCLHQGILVRFIKDFIVSHIQSKRFSNKVEIDFFILVDDCESLSPKQQILLNSYIRSTEGLAKWVISFIADQYNTIKSLSDLTDLTADDRVLLELNDISEADFSEFCEQVTCLRLIKFLEALNVDPSTLKPNFSLKGTFGEISYNVLLEAVFKKSQNLKTEPFKREVGQTKAHLQSWIKKALYPRFYCEDDQTPFIEHVFFEAMDINPSDYATKDEQISLAKTIDGRQAAIYIAICAKYNVRPIYGGMHFIKAVSDTSIRDYLDTIGSIFSQVTGQNRDKSTSISSLVSASKKFLSGESIGFRIQDPAIQSVSNTKFENLEHLRAFEPQVYHLVKSFSAFQECIELDHEEWRAVRNRTRGIYQLELPIRLFDGLPINSADVKKLMLRLEYDRFIKLLHMEETAQVASYKFTIHRRLRPHLKCGHAGPFKPEILITPSAFLEVVLASESFDPEKWAREQYLKMLSYAERNSTSQIELPL